MIDRGVSIAFEPLVGRLQTLLEQAGASPFTAEVIARNCAGCERDGASSHGVFRLHGYLDSLRSGTVDGAAEPVLERVGPSFLRVDAANGFAQPALRHAQPVVDGMLAETGIAVVAIKDSHHFSALWPDLEPFAVAGFVGLTMVVGGTRVVRPRGAAEPVFGTNPIAFATPVRGASPIVFDLATSSMSHGDLQLARNASREVPPGTGTDRDGRDTTDPGEILAARGLLPFGGHKGAALSFMVEVLAAGLTGGAFSYEAELEQGAARTRRTGQLLVLIDPDRGGGGFAARIEQLVAFLRESGMTRLPADHRYRNRAQAERDGIPMTDAIAEIFADASLSSDA
ncbi:Ldh family oxidoreductase [Agromyces endophyticus]|uniref:Ldh family oxidoreductase n=1 Tax=Agromyces sp. H17E-10 TaxID=2932244 RepID=UPI001FD3A0CE|nr:Ldh family oxidoreductase [Agromyces sp. H17E-10]UOQ90531.1 Ldh family oxidoreductase [Agromyces sp. H17E-10]